MHGPVNSTCVRGMRVRGQRGEQVAYINELQHFANVCGGQVRVGSRQADGQVLLKLIRSIYVIGDRYV